VQRPTIVITGSALATSLGLSREETWSAIVAGRCGSGPMPALETALPAGKDGAQAIELPGDYAPEQPREVRYLRWTIESALRDAGVLDRLSYAPERCGYLLGTTLHGMRSAGEFLRYDNLDVLKNFQAGATLRNAASPFGLTGLAITTCSACSSSLGAIALAVTLLQAGELDLIIAGGYDTVSEYVFGGFNSLRLVADGPLRPFARDRRGMKLGEGYGLVVLERSDDARRRGAKTYAQVLGFGESADAHHLTQPHPQGEGAARAIRLALASADISAQSVDLIAAHATGTPDNDAGEFAAFSAVFAEHLPQTPVVAFKSHLGHTLGGAGAVELILSACAIQSSTIPACANSRAQDIEFPGLNLSVATQTRPIQRSLNTSLGFGGANTCVVLGAPSLTRTSQLTPQASFDPVITGIGVIVPGATGNNEFISLISSARDPVKCNSGPIDEAAYLHLLNARRVRRMSDYVKLSLAATALAVQDSALPADFAESCAVLLGSAHGSSTYASQYYAEIVKQGYIGANPMLFAEGVPNAAAAHLSLMLGLKGACQTIIGTRTAGLDALRLAATRIRNGDWDRCLVGAAEEYDNTINRAYAHCRLHAAEGEGSVAFDSEERGFVTGAAAITLVLESRQSAESRNARIYGSVISGAGRLGAPAESPLSIAATLASLGSANHILSSANGTWVDRAELAGIRRASPDAIVGTTYGKLAEYFSASPLLGIAATLLSGVLPNSPSGSVAKFDRFAALCTDYTGWVSGISLLRVQSSAR